MFSFGFYNSKDGDRKYNATHFGKIFDGIIQDGVFGAVQSPLDTMFNVVPDETPGLSAIINPGKAWLMHTWNILDTRSVISFNQTVANTKRTDVVVLEVNNDYTSLQGSNPRTNSIKVVEGTPVYDTSPDSVPALTQIWNTNQSERRIWQYPIAYVTIYGSNKDSGTVDTQFTANVIKAANIKNRINVSGESEENKYKTWTPLVTGATMNLDLGEYYPDWSGLFDQFLLSSQAEFNTWFDDLHNTVVIDSSAQAALTRLNDKIDNKIIYGTTEPPSTLDIGQVYFMIED